MLSLTHSWARARRRWHRPGTTGTSSALRAMADTTGLPWKGSWRRCLKEGMSALSKDNRCRSLLFFCGLGCRPFPAYQEMELYGRGQEQCLLKRKRQVSNGQEVNHSARKSLQIFSAGGSHPLIWQPALSFLRGIFFVPIIFFFFLLTI